MYAKVAIDHNIQPEFHDVPRKPRLEAICDIVRYPPDVFQEGLTGLAAQFCLQKLFRDLDRATLKDVR